MTSRISPRTGRVRKRPTRPRLSLTDRLANLHLLLRAKSFLRWPLKLTFFSDDVYRVWQKLTSQTIETLRPGITVTKDESSYELRSAVEPDEASNCSKPNGIYALDLGYSSFKDRLKKSRSIFSTDQSPRCSVCRQDTPAPGAATLLCTNPTCNAVSHLQCLSASFLQAEENQNTLIPTQGFCLSCGTQIQWADLVKELSLRMRGEKEVKALFKPKRGKKGPVGAAMTEDIHSSAEEDELLGMVSGDADQWHELSESSDDEIERKRIRSDLSLGHTVFKPAMGTERFSEPIVEDSDWENADLIA